ncbi:FABP5 [Ramazzottius varieornatus]|nr:FABP5 [Ramazzottius varieornatus]
MAQQNVDITGLYKLTSSENFDEYLKAVGVSWALRTAVKALGSVGSATVEITKIGQDEYSIKTVTSIKQAEIKFKLGQEFVEKTLDGRDVNTTFTLTGNTLKQTQKDPKGDFQTTVDRDFVGDEMTTTMRAKDVVCVRKYHKEPKA